MNPDFSLISLLNGKMLQQPFQKRDYTIPKTTPSVWPTEASVTYNVTVEGRKIKIVEGACLRQVFYRITGAEKTDERIEPRLNWIWRQGENFERDVNDLCRMISVLAGEKLRFKDETFPSLPISGEIDAVLSIEHPTTKTPFFVVVDWKTTGGYHNSSGIMGNTKKDPFPKVSNLLQLMVYLKQDPRLSYGKLLYFVRDDCTMTEFTVRLVEDQRQRLVAMVKSVVMKEGVTILDGTEKEYPQYSINSIYSRYGALADAIAANALPPRDYQLEYTDERFEDMVTMGELSKTAIEQHQKGKKVGDTECQYCDWRSRCWKIDS